MICMQPTVIVNGRTWNLYELSFKAEDSTYSTYIYALSFEHASYMLEDLKKTGVIGGQIISAEGKKP